MKNNHKFRLDIWGIITLLTLAMYLIFMVYPLGNLIKMAFYDDNGLTLNNFIKFFSKSYYSITLSNSFKISLAATATSLLIGIPMAYFFALYRIRGKALLRILIIISSMSAPFVGAYAWILLLGWFWISHLINWPLHTRDFSRELSGFSCIIGMRMV